MTEAQPESAATTSMRPRLPPNWFIRFAWAVHRAIFRWTGGRRGIWKAKPEAWGTFRLHTVGRKSGKERIAILGYQPDGENVVTVAMNGWMEGDPAWWLNLQAHADAVVRLPDEGPRAVRARAARGEERDRLWRQWRSVAPKLDGYAGRRAIETPVVVLEPRDGAA